MRPAPRLLVGLFLLTLFAFSTATAADYALIRLHGDSPALSSFLANHPELDVVQFKPAHGAEIVVTPATMDVIKDSGLNYEVVHQDLVGHYQSKIENKDTNFGGWHTYSENIAYLDSLHTEYPELISEKWSLGTTHENRNIWCVRLSDNASMDEAGEPEILLDTMHHAREIMAGEFGILWADYLCSNYGTDPTITWLMDNRELYLISMINPDGVAYNEQTQPQGGGMWRKNRRNNGGSYGVDPNRNYPFEWVGPGSSSDPSSDTYRGPSAASEPEVQALMNLVNSHDFVTHQTLHTFGNITIHPWGYSDSPSPDHGLFQHMGSQMTQYNGYDYGYVGDLLGYQVNGVTFDWVYAGEGHDKIYSVSNEIGNSGDGFWPSFSRRDALFQANIWPMKYLMMAAGAFAEVNLVAATDLNGESLEPGEEGLLSLAALNQGLTETLSGMTVTVSCDDPYIQFTEAQRTVGSLAPMANLVIEPALPFMVDAQCPDGHAVAIDVMVTFDGSELPYQFNFVVGASSLVFSDNFDFGTSNWIFEGNWGLSGTAYSAPNSLTDSPSGDYPNAASSSATIDEHFQASSINFWHRFDIEAGYDYGRLQVSADGGTWQTVASYTGQQNTWQEETIDLGQFAGQDLRIRFSLESDDWVTEDGWYIDNISVYGASSSNQLPATPLSLAPGDGASLSGQVLLTVANVTDPEGDGVDYGFRVYSDPLLTTVAATVDAVPAGDGEETNWTVSPSLAAGTFYWRAYAADSIERGMLGETRSFTLDQVSGINDVVIGSPSLRVLAQGSDQAELQLTLSQASEVMVKIYNARGQLVRDLYSGHVESRHVMVWDGRDVSGRNVASGVYFVQVQAGVETLNSRVVMVR